MEDLALEMRALLVPRMFATDAYVTPLPFNLEEYTRPVNRENPLRIGYYITDGFFEPCAAARRAVQEAVAALGGVEGVELVPFTFPRGYEAVALYYQVMTSDAAVEVLSALQVSAGTGIHSVLCVGGRGSAAQWMADAVVLCMCVRARSLTRCTTR